jgi:hypothetical protein
MEKKMDVLEQGQASMMISLDYERVEVRHGETDVLMAYLNKAPDGTWAKLWELLYSMNFIRVEDKHKQEAGE